VRLGAHTGTRAGARARARLVRPTVRQLFAARGLPPRYSPRYHNELIPTRILDSVFGPNLDFGKDSGRSKLLAKVADAMIFHDVGTMHPDGDGLFENILEPYLAARVKSDDLISRAARPSSLNAAKTVARLQSEGASVMEIGVAASGIAVDFTRAEAKEFVGVDLGEREWRTARWWSMGPGVGVSMKPEVRRRCHRCKKSVLLDDDDDDPDDPDDSAEMDEAPFERLYGGANGVEEEEDEEDDDDAMEEDVDGGDGDTGR